MKRKSLAKKLLTCCTILSGNALAAEINVTGVYTEPRRAGTLSDNYNFNGGSNTLNILLNSNVVLTGMLLNAQNSTLTVANNAAPPKFTISNNASVINIGNIHLISMWNWWGTSSFVVNNTSTTTFTGKWLHIDREPFWGYQDWHVIFASPTIITHSSIGDMLKDDNSSWRWGYIGSKAAPSSLTYATERGHDIGNICFAHQDSEFIIDNSNSTSHTTYYFFSQFLNTFGGGATFNNFGGGVANEIDDIPSIAPVDSAGTLRLVANGSSMTLEGKSLGINNTSRLNLLEVSGSKAVTINLDIYTKNINFNSSGNIVFKSLDMGSKNNITLQQNTNLSLNTQLKSASPTINLGNNLLKISSGTVTLTGDATINTEFTAANSKNGRITVENSTLNLNGLNTLNLNFNANTANENISTNDEQEFEFKVFESLNGGTINNINSKNITFTPTESNLFITWDYDANTHTLKSITNWNGLQELLDETPDPVPENAVVLVNAITSSARSNTNTKESNDQTSKTPAARRLIQILGSFENPEDLLQVLENINQSKSTLSGDNGEIEATQQITHRIVSNIAVPSIDTPIGRQELQGANADELGLGTGAGDDLSSRYGTWFSPLYQKGIQRKIGVDSGYKVVNFGGVIGVDYKTSENTTIGLAWSNVKSNLKHSDAKSGSKGVTDSNILSLYGLVELPRGYFVSTIGSCGISNVRNRDKRPLTNKIIQYAQSKYKSYTYSGQILSGKNIALSNKYLLTPMVGIKYIEFHDNGYQETGTTLQNFNVSKKKSSQCDGIVGAKLSYDSIVGNYRIVPNLTGMAYFSLKSNPPTAYVTSDAFITPIQFKGLKKSSKAWYTIGASVDLFKDNTEYSLSYENQIDKKYIGHLAKIKIKANF